MLRSSTVRKDQIKGFIDGVLDLVLPKDNSLSLNKDYLDSFSQKMTDALIDQHDNKDELTQEAFFNIADRLVMNIRTNLAFEGTLESKAKGLDDILDNLLDGFKNSEDNKLSPDDMKNKNALTKFLEKCFGKEKAAILTKAIEDFSNKNTKNLEAVKIKPKPGSKPEQVQEDININLLGMVCSQIAGGHRVTLQSFIGNFYAVPDQNPHDYGEDNLSKQASFQDTGFADPIGLNSIAENRCDALGDTVLELDVKHLMKTHGIGSLTPTPGQPAK